MTEKASDVLRRCFSASLASFPFATAFGRVVSIEPLQLGAPSGSHPGATFWRYEARATPHVFHFGFVPNFTPDDLMCKVSIEVRRAPFLVSRLRRRPLTACDGDGRSPRNPGLRLP